MVAHYRPTTRHAPRVGAPAIEVGLGAAAVLSFFMASAAGGDLVDLGRAQPVVAFDMPADLVARDVTPPGYQDQHAGGRLVEVTLPVSVVLYRGDVARVGEVIVEVDGADAGLTVHAYAPETTLETDVADPIESTQTTEAGRSIDGSLGGVIPGAAGTVGHLTPTVRAGVTRREVETTTELRRPPKHAVVVSGAVNQRRGVYFKLRRSTQSTLEGEHVLSVTFAAPADWSAGRLNVQCVARGEQKVLFVRQPKVWEAQVAPIELRLASHVVAKPIVRVVVPDGYGLEEADGRK